MKKLNKKIKFLIVLVLIAPLFLFFSQVFAATFIFPDEINENTTFDYNGTIWYQWVKKSATSSEMIAEWNRLIGELESQNAELLAQKPGKITQRNTNLTEIDRLTGLIEDLEQQNVALNINLGGYQGQIDYWSAIVGEENSGYYVGIEGDNASLKQQIDALIATNRSAKTTLDANHYQTTAQFFNAHVLDIRTYAVNTLIPNSLRDKGYSYRTFTTPILNDAGIIDGNYNIFIINGTSEIPVMEGSEYKYLVSTAAENYQGISRVRVSFSTTVTLTDGSGLNYSGTFTYTDSNIETLIQAIISDYTTDANGNTIITRAGRNDQIEELIAQYNRNINIIARHAQYAGYYETLDMYRGLYNQTNTQIQNNLTTIANYRTEITRLEGENTTLTNEINNIDSTVASNREAIERYELSISTEQNKGQPSSTGWILYNGHIQMPADPGDYTLWVRVNGEDKSKDYTLAPIPDKYTFHMPSSPGVKKVTVRKTGGYGDVNYELKEGDRVYEGDTLTITAEPETGYTLNPYDTTVTVTGDVNLNITSTPNQYTLHISKGTGVATVKVIKQSGYGTINTELTEGSAIYYGDVLLVSGTSSTGYILDTFQTSYTVSNDTTVSVTASPAPYTLTITKGTGVDTITVKNGGTTLNNNATIHYGDTLNVTATALPGYTLSPYTTTYNVTGNTTVSVEAVPNKYKLTISPGTGVKSITVRKITGYGGSQNLANNSDIYFGDVLQVTAEAEDGYQLNTYNQNVTVSGNTTVSVTAAPRGYRLTIDKKTGVADITVTRENGNRVNNNDTIYYNERLNITATASEGYTLNSYASSVTVNGNTTVSVDATPNQYRLNITTGLGVKSVTVTKTSGHGSDVNKTLSNGAVIYYDDKLTVTAEANEGYQIDSFTQNVTVKGNTSINITASPRAYTLTINKKTGVESITVTRQKGNVTLKNGDTIYYNETLLIDATASSGYTLSYFDRTILVNGDTTVSVDVIPNSYKLTLNPGTGVKSITVTKTSGYGSDVNKTLSNGATIYYGDTLTVTAEPEGGYKLNNYTKNITVNGATTVSVTASPTTYVLTIDKKAGVQTLKVIRENGNVELQNGATIYYNENLIVEATASEGYELASYSRNVKVAGNTTVSVTATPKSYKLAITPRTGVKSITVKKVSGYGSDVNKNLANDATIYYGDRLTVTAEPEPGYRLNSYTQNVTVTGNTLVSVSAEIIPYKLTIEKGTGVESITVTKTNGNEVLNNNDTIYYGDTLTVTATASEGYTLKSYTRNITVTGNTNVKVEASLTPYTITIVKGEGVDSVTVTKGNTKLKDGDVVYFGDALAIEAVPKTGYTIKNFTRNVSVDGNITIRIEAEPTSYTISIGAGEGVKSVTITKTSGYGSNVGQVLHDGDTIYFGDKLSISAEAEDGYSLNTYPRSVIVNGRVNISITARDSSAEEETPPSRKFKITKGEGIEKVIVTKESGYGVTGIEIQDGDTIYEGDVLKIEAIAKDGYVIESYDDSVTVGNGDVEININAKSETEDPNGNGNGNGNGDINNPDPNDQNGNGNGNGIENPEMGITSHITTLFGITAAIGIVLKFTGKLNFFKKL